MDNKLAVRLRKFNNPLMNQAAATIELKDIAIMELYTKVVSLEKELKNCRNELCLRCGSYREAHKGACDGCRYKEMG